MKPSESIEYRIKRIEKDIENAERYLNGEEADLTCFKPYQNFKYDDNGKELPPHKDWVKNVYIKHCKECLTRENNALRSAISKERKRNKEHQSSAIEEIE